MEKQKKTKNKHDFCFNGVTHQSILSLSHVCAHSRSLSLSFSLSLSHLKNYYNNSKKLNKNGGKYCMRAENVRELENMC